MEYQIIAAYGSTQCSEIRGAKVVMHEFESRRTPGPIRERHSAKRAVVKNPYGRRSVSEQSIYQPVSDEIRPACNQARLFAKEINGVTDLLIHYLSCCCWPLCDTSFK